MLELVLTALATATAAAATAVTIGRRGHRAALARAADEAERVVREGRTAADAARREILVEAESRARALAARIQEERARFEAKLAATEARLEARDQALARKADELEEREQEVTAQNEGLQARRATVEGLEKELGALGGEMARTVERTAGHTREVALAHLRQELIDSSGLAAQKAARLREEHARASAEMEARRLIDLVSQRYGTALPADRLVSTVTLPKPGKVRDRVLADDAALLQAITAATQVEFIRNGEDEVLYLAAPEPYVREIGRLTYERLVTDREPREALVPKLAQRVATELDRTVRAAGQKAVDLLRLGEMHPDIKQLVGKLLYRTSYTQNQWQHAIETAYLCGMMAEDLGVDPRIARRAALIHDIGKVLWAETEAVGSHAVSGAAFARERGESPEVVHPIAAHHDDEKPATVYAHIVAAADALSGARPGARRETEEAFGTRVEDLERVCAEVDGIEKAFVIQGGRELRVVVDNGRLTDLDAARLSLDLARRIEDQLTFPGQIKVTVIRETRATALAR